MLENNENPFKILTEVINVVIPNIDRPHNSDNENIVFQIGFGQFYRENTAYSFVLIILLHCFRNNHPKLKPYKKFHVGNSLAC